MLKCRFVAWGQQWVEERVGRMKMYPHPCTRVDHRQNRKGCISFARHISRLKKVVRAASFHQTIDRTMHETPGHSRLARCKGGVKQIEWI